MTMEREDKIAFGFFLGLLCLVGLGIIFLIKWLGAALFGAFAAGTDGLGYRDAFLISLGLSFGVIVVFALVAGGEELLGELPFVLIGFFSLLIFFTLSLALVL